MIAYIRGRLEYVDLEEGMAVLETGGIGYQILLSGRDLELLPSAGEEVRLYTYLQVRDDAFVLYGFLPERTESCSASFWESAVSGRKGRLAFFRGCPRMISGLQFWQTMPRLSQRRRESD